MLKVIAIIILILLGRVVVFASLRQRKLVINKGVIIIAVIATGLLLLSNTFGNNNAASLSSAPYYQTLAPPVQKAPFYLQTPSRAYYVATSEETDQYLTLTNYYYFDRKEWELSNIPLHFDKSLSENSKLKISKRKIGG